MPPSVTAILSMVRVLLTELLPTVSASVELLSIGVIHSTVRLPRPVATQVNVATPPKSPVTSTGICEMTGASTGDQDAGRNVNDCTGNIQLREYSQIVSSAALDDTLSRRF